MRNRERNEKFKNQIIFKDNFKGNLSTKHQTAWEGGGYRSSMGCSIRILHPRYLIFYCLTSRRQAICSLGNRLASVSYLPRRDR